MKKDDDHYLVPQHENGSKKDIESGVVADSTEDAEDWFIDAKEKLLDVNNWNKYSTALSASFVLADSSGKEVHRAAHKGNFIHIQLAPQTGIEPVLTKMDMPASNNTTGSGYDWAHIEAIEYDDYPDISMETIAMRIRPCKNPQEEGKDNTHFFDKGFTGTFVIERLGKALQATYHGRNEAPNADTGITCAWMDMPDSLWESLIQGMLALL